MANTIFIEKSYIAASILNVKYKFLNEDFVTIEELNYISDKFQKKLNEQNFDAIILDKIDTDYFDISDIIKINKSKGLSFESIINHYQGYLDLGILLLIWNKETILNYLEEIKTNFDVMAVPYRRTFVVARDKTEEFLNQKPNHEIRQQQKEMVEKFRKNILVEEGPVLTKTIKPLKK